MMNIQRPRGTADLLPDAIGGWQRLEQVVRTTLEIAHYQEIRTPIFEHTELFERGVGDTTDIVEKEMYTFLDRGGRSITLRPEGTAGVVRAFAENKLYGNPGISKLYYIGPMFRYEKPQRGRLRQFHQYGCEVFGAEGPAIDAEVIGLNYDILKNFGLQNLGVELNSVGCSKCRPRHKELMIAALAPHSEELCVDCQRRLHRNPLRIFDCKNESCQRIVKDAQAPKILDVLCDECKIHLNGVQAYLTTMKIPFVISDDLVRGLDYYTRTAWEITAPGYSTIAGGGRYNSLVAEVGGPETPGIGFAGGMERALMVLQGQQRAIETKPTLDVFVVVANPLAEMAATEFVRNMREQGLVVDRDYQGKSMKAQFKMADREKARFVVILGEDEMANGYATVKDLTTSVQKQISFAQLTESIHAQFIAEKTRP